MFGLFGKRQYKDLSVRAYHSDFVKSERPHQLVDVRTPGEFAQGHIPGAINIPLNDIKGRANELTQESPVIVVCATGNRSMSGANQIASAGFTEVYNVQGGTMGWLREGFKTEK